MFGKVLVFHPLYPPPAMETRTIPLSEEAQGVVLAKFEWSLILPVITFGHSERIPKAYLPEAQPR